MLYAAFKSLSIELLHLSQRYVLSESFKSFLWFPQLEHTLLLGSKRPITTRFLPCQVDLYSSIVLNCRQPISDIALAKLWFFTILLTAKSSITIVSYVFTNSVDILCPYSVLWLRIFSCSNATFNFCFSLFIEPLCNLERLLCSTRNLLCCDLKNFLFSYTIPSEVIAKSLIPKSTPTDVSVLIVFCFGFSVCVSTNIETKYLPVTVFVNVTFFGSPLNSLW